MYYVIRPLRYPQLLIHIAQDILHVLDAYREANEIRQPMYEFQLFELPPFHAIRR